jgi:hypothetical protein
LNQLIRGDFTVAEVVVSPRPFVALQLNNLASQKVLITGIAWNALCAPADKANAQPILFIQRGLTVTTTTDIGAVENFEEMIIQMSLDTGDGRLYDVYTFPSPIELESGYPYVVGLALLPRAAFVGAAILLLTVLGRQVSAQTGGELPPLR